MGTCVVKRNWSKLVGQAAICTVMAFVVVVAWCGVVLTVVSTYRYLVHGVM